MRSVRTVNLHDGIIDVAGDADVKVPEGLTREDLMLRFTVQRRDGVTARGAAGFVAVWRASACQAVPEARFLFFVISVEILATQEDAGVGMPSG